MTERDPEKDHPERFKKAVRAACAVDDNDYGCDYPQCNCLTLPMELKVAIMAWNELAPGLGERARPSEGEKDV